MCLNGNLLSSGRPVTLLTFSFPPPPPFLEAHPNCHVINLCGCFLGSEATSYCETHAKRP